MRTDDDVEKFIEYVTDRPYNDLRYLMDSSKLHRLGWEPRTSWEEGIEKTSKGYTQICLYCIVSMVHINP